MLYNFSTRFDEKMEAEMQLLGRSKNDIIIIASIIEKETDGSDQKNIASVLYNRLNNTWRRPEAISRWTPPYSIFWRSERKP